MGKSATHTYSSPGNYTVTLTVTDDDGLTSTISKVIRVTSSVTPLVSQVVRELPSTIFPGEEFAVTIISTAPAIGMEIREVYPENFTFINYSVEGASNFDFSQSDNLLRFIVTDIAADGFTITYYLRASGEGTYYFSGTYEVLGGAITSIGGDSVIEVVSGETVPDDIPDDMEKVVSKYNPDFDWRTETPTKPVVLNAVINAVSAYFSTSDESMRQEIIDDVIILVSLYFMV